MARQLSPSEIQQILVAFFIDRRSKLSIAREHQVDHSTVIYHIRKYEKAYPEQGGVYAFVKGAARKVCSHPSYHCLLCGKARNAIKREERMQVRELTERLLRANQRLARAGLPSE